MVYIQILQRRFFYICLYLFFRNRKGQFLLEFLVFFIWFYLLFIFCEFCFQVSIEVDFEERLQKGVGRYCVLFIVLKRFQFNDTFRCLSVVVLFILVEVVIFLFQFLFFKLFWLKIIYVVGKVSFLKFELNEIIGKEILGFVVWMGFLSGQVQFFFEFCSFWFQSRKDCKRGFQSWVGSIYVNFG